MRQTNRARSVWTMMLAVACGFALARAADKNDKIDWDKVKQLHNREVQGEKLTAEEQAYLEQAKAAYQRGDRPDGSSAATAAKSTESKPAPTGGSGIDWAKANELHERFLKGEKLTAEEQAYHDKAQAIINRGEGPGATALATGGKPAPAGGEAIDWEKAKQLHQRATSGEKLTTEEQAYYDRAKAAMQRGQGPNAGANPGGQQRPDIKVIGLTSGLKPLTDMTADDKYKGEDGGLYGGGKNEPPEQHLQAALKLAKEIQPLDADGKPSPHGKIGFISLGMSNTTQEFSEFVHAANADPAASMFVAIVDCAQGGMEAMMWATAGKGNNRPNAHDPWTTIDERIQAAGVSPKQVQVIWIKLARAQPETQGEYPKHADEMRGHYTVILNKLAEKFPNLKVAYNSSRIYAGYATTRLNPEPFAYEEAFVVRRLIQDQIKGESALNCDPSKGTVKSPLLLWGPYLWADGEKGRKFDDLVWKQDDLGPDGTHPNRSGQKKVVDLLLSFFKSDATTKGWFVK